MRQVDDFLVETSPSKEQAKNETFKVMKDLKCSGVAFVMLSNEEAVGELLNALKSQPEVMGCPLKCRRPTAEPLSVMWENFDRPEERHTWRTIATGVVCLVSSICIWALLYIPYAIEFSHSAQVPGHTPSMLSGFVLGGLIGLGNVMVGKVVETVIGWIGFGFKDGRDLWVLALAFLFSLLNVVADVTMTLQIAKGANLDEAFYGDEVGYDKVIVREMFAMVVPGYLFVPYLVEPVFEYILPYWIYRWLVRSDVRFSQREAEKALEPPEFEIVWHCADSLNNFVVCISLLLFVTPGSSSIMLWLFAFVVYIYFLDKFRLENYSQSLYTTQSLTCAFILWWAVPTGVLAGVVAWWGIKAGVLVGSSPFLIVCQAGLWHTAIYLAVVCILYSFTSLEKRAYGEYNATLVRRRKAGRGWDYFTANPGYCLRTWGTEEGKEEEIFPFVRGKIHLLPWREWDCGGASHDFASEVLNHMVMTRPVGLFRSLDARPDQASGDGFEK
jgi:hypothetical protein